MPFVSDYVPVDIAPDGTYVLTDQVVYRGRDDTFTVSAGFHTDLTSVPRLMTWLVPIAGVHDRAAIVHDWLCSRLEVGASARHLNIRFISPPPASARDTDGIFRRILRELGVPLVRRWLMWAGVRWSALTTPARRSGWWRDAPLVLAVTAVALPFLLLPALFVGLTLLIDLLVEKVR